MVNILLNNNFLHTVSWNSLILSSLTIGCFIYFSNVLRPWFRAVILALRLSGPRAWPIVGNCLLAIDPNVIQNLAMTVREDYGPVFRSWISIVPAIVLTNPEHVQLILGSPKHTGKSFLYRLLHNFLGEGLITNTGSKWKVHRKLIQPLFSNNILISFIDTFSDSSQLLLTRLEKYSGKDLNITSLINDSVLDILNEAVLGVPINNNLDENIGESPFRKGKVVAPYRLVRPWLLFNWLYGLTEVAKSELEQKNSLFNFTKKMIEYNKAKDKADLTGRKSLLQMFQDISYANPTFTEEDIIQEICTFMLAGQDSVGSAVAFCLYSLAKHQHEQDLVIEELDAIFKDSNRLPNARDIDEMYHLEKCIKETLRLYPSVPLFSRKVSQDVKINDSITIPQDCTVFISPFVTHRIPEIYPDPQKFVPKRFDSEEVLKRHPYAFIPFSAGPRNCIGYKFSLIEMKTMVSTILRHYRLELTPDKEELTLTWRITVRARGGIWLRLIPRSN